MPGDQAEPANVEFVEFHQPALPDGTYTIKATQNVAYADKITKDADFTTVEQRFRVAGERFRLAPTDVVDVFPPDGSTGDHSMVLPHIVLRRSTLPWERFSCPDERDLPARPSGESVPTTPWLGVLVFSEADLAQVTTHVVAFSELGGPAGSPVRFPVLAAEDERSTDQITVVDMPWSVLSSVMPSPAELRLLTHVRQTTDAGGAPVGPEVAVMMAGRLPMNDQSTTAHLVSLEGWFDSSGTPVGSTSDAPARLVSLKSWKFSCSGDAGGIADRLRGLNRTPVDGSDVARYELPYLRLPSSYGSDPIIDRGGVPLAHQLRDGGRTVSVYRGPFVGFTPVDRPASGVLPATCADDLLAYHHDLGILEVGEAAAWELGRLLTMRSTRVANELASWKRTEARREVRRRQAEADSHLPGHQLAASDDAFVVSDLPAAVAEWFEDLRLLKGVPFHYLVPDESMLPPESLRCFSVDPHWLRALIDGAFSIGRVTTRDHRGDQTLVEKIESIPTMSGVLIRSSVVAGWPDLIAEAGSTRVLGGDISAGNRLELLRMERLGPEVLLCLFLGQLRTLDLAQKPETLHFGLDVNAADPSTYSKRLRNSVGAEFDVSLPSVPWMGDDQASRRVDVLSLAEHMRAALSAHRLRHSGEGALDVPMTANSAWFALEMIEGVQRIRFTFAP